MTANADQRDHWNSDEAQHWVRYEDAHNIMLEPFGRALLDAAALPNGGRVLDVGCGTGWTSIEAGKLVGPDGALLGADLSAPMITRARARATEAGLDHVRFAVADAQTEPFGDRFDAIISRFGVMFFDDPRAAFTNLGRALADGGQLSFVCWQELLANEWMAVPGAAVATRIPLPDLGRPGAPGPFSLSEPETIRALLGDSGFADVTVEPFETTVTLGGGLPLDETLEYLRTSGLGRAVFADATSAQIDDAIDAVRGALEPHQTADGIRLGGAAWLATARLAR